MTRSMGYLLLSGVSLLALSGAAMAQSTADIVYLGEIEIGGGDATAPVAGYVADSAQTATKSTMPLLVTPQSVTVITGDQIEDQGGTNLGDTLRYTTGVFAQPYGTDPRFDAPTIRGFDASNAQYLNGLRLMRDFGAPSFETYSLERIEVLRGPASALYGSGSPGGLINQIQKRAYMLDFGEAGVGIGDPEASEAFVDINRAFSDSFAARITAVGRQTKEDVSELENTRGYLGLATRWLIDDRTTLQFLGSYQKDSPISPAGIPYDLIGQQDGRDLRSFYAGEPDDDDSDRTIANIGFELNRDLGAGWNLDMGFRYQKFDWDYTGYYVNNAVTDGDTITRGANNQYEDSSTLNLDTRVSGDVILGGLQHNLLFGLDLRRYDSWDKTEFLYADPISYSNPVYGNGNLSAPWYTAENDLTIDQVGVYAQDEITIGALNLSMALRHDWVSQSGTTYTNFAGTSPADQDDQATTGRIGASYLLDNGVAPYISYSTSFDPEVGADIDGKALKPTEGEQWEAGIKYQPDGFNGFFTAAVFSIDQTNVSSTVTENGISGTRQIGKVKSQGLELEGVMSLADGWNLHAGYTYNKTEQQGGDNAGAELPNAPENFGSVWLTHDFDGNLDGLTLGGGVRYVGDRFGDAANLYKLDEVVLVDLVGEYELTENVHLAVNVTNLTDEVYVANCGSFGCYYGDGRTVQARLTYKW
ncbi:Ferric hydroxamate uptake [Marinibacterium anthonyi]|nr:Ferric hydroxamate uptake [Marinibacterium anthonyi]